MRARAKQVRARGKERKERMGKASWLLAVVGAMTLSLAASGPSISGSASKPAVETASAARTLQAPPTNPTAAQPAAAGAVPAKQEPLKPKGKKKAAPASPAVKGPDAAVTAKRQVKPAEETKEKGKAAPPLPPISARRDPFRNPLLLAAVPVNLPPGKAGLIIAQLRVDGIVRAPNGMLAVVSNTAKRTYFLREGDQLYDGLVQKISSESVTFEENTKDVFGRAITREVVKRLYPTTAGEEK